ncbi:MAG TPA: ATP-binding protein [Candidatus Acidoferrum sp.]|nr:ATP-binding protein [Candidatus Acidoferrum sp.]
MNVAGSQLAPRDLESTVRLLQDELETTNREVMLLTLELEQRVSDRTTQLTQSNQKLLKEVADRLRAEVEIRQLNRTLEERAGLLEVANEELEAFSASVSHDLRNPVSRILGFASLLDEDFNGLVPERRQRYIVQIRDAARKMTALIDDLLRLSHSSRIPLVFTSVDLNQLVTEVVGELKGEERNYVEWTVTALPAVMADASLLRQVFVNLLGNALKYSRTRNPARIEIGETPSAPDEWTLFIRDNGVGFDSTKKDKLFGAFQRLHTAQEFEGTGLGLVNVKRIVVRHGGKVWAESQPGEGAVFYFTLPRHQPVEDCIPSSGGSK